MLQKFYHRLANVSHSSPAVLFGTISRKDLYPPSPSAAPAATVDNSNFPGPSAASSEPSSRAFRRSSSFLKRSALKEKRSSATEARDYARKSADIETRSVPDFWEPSPPRKMSAQDARTRPVGRSVKIALRPTKFIPPPNMPPLTYSSSTNSLSTFSPKESVYTHLAPHTRAKKHFVDIGVSAVPPFDPPPPINSPQGPFAPLTAASFEPHPIPEKKLSFDPANSRRKSPSAPQRRPFASLAKAQVSGYSSIHINAKAQSK